MSSEGLDEHDPGSLGHARVLDPASRAWLEGLAGAGAQRDACMRELHALLLRIARHEAVRRTGRLRIQGAELDDVVHQAADDALMAIKTKLGEFRGESRFTTWAYRFVMFEVSTKLARHVWRHRPLDLDQFQWERLPDVLACSPDERVEQRQLLAAVRRAVEHDLTELQRRVFVAVVIEEVPMDTFAREVGSNRNAIYKTLFDARRKLRASLLSAGHSAPDAMGESL